MTPEDFDRLQSLMVSRSGYALTSDRMQLAEHRLGPIARREGFHNVEALLANLWARPVGSLAWSIIESLLNTETWFRRERNVFDLYAREILPALAKARNGRPIRIWVAGGASGQEAFSLAMSALEQDIAVDILSTDLSRRALEKGGRGIYSGFEIQRGLTAHAMLRWFGPVEDQWQAKPDLRRIIHFDRANLLDPLPPDLTAKGPFDLIFCRNVISDMVPDAQMKVLDRLYEPLLPDGCLFLGTDERTDTKQFRPVAGRAGLYVKAPNRDQFAA
ncbi:MULTISPECIES: CheR family methyltransferase [unclassified Brevundimonas]|uniref:CheR family methyltransferase n=1 Tax=unclassified Brevundimonas TaxID=2622653 RepID=UPI0025C046B0|nr:MULTISPECIES: CheR family methyltransferase [unclassified Brevundimonas]